MCMAVPSYFTRKKRFVIIIISWRFLLRNIYLKKEKNLLIKAILGKFGRVKKNGSNLKKKINHGGMVEDET